MWYFEGERIFYPHLETKDRLNPWCKDCTRLINKAWYAKNKEVASKNGAKWRAVNRKHIRLKQNARNKAYPEVVKESSRKAVRKRKLLIIEHYGGKCVCCGEEHIEFLTIDHINNNGAAHKKELGGSSALYHWLKRNNYPKDDFQLLCMNCNFSKGKYGYCPHSISKEVISGIKM